jgi:hypothetical protein
MSRTLTFGKNWNGWKPESIKYEYPLGTQTGPHEIENFLGESRVDVNRAANMATTPLQGLASRPFQSNATVPTTVQNSTTDSSPVPTTAQQATQAYNPAPKLSTATTQSFSTEYEPQLTPLRNEYLDYGTGGGGEVSYGQGGGENWSTPAFAYTSQYDQETDNYINDLLADAKGDLDFALKQLDRQHEVALGTDEQARAKFLEDVADKLEERIGRIPYDYEKYTTRLKDDTSKVLGRLFEDEKVWKEQFGKDTAEGRQSQAEALAARGLLQGTRQGAGGIPGQEVRKFEGDVQNTLSAYDRALARQTSDTKETETRGLEDLKTEARRGAIDQTDQYKFGTEASQRAYEAKKKALEREREAQKRLNLQRANIETGAYYGY